MENEINTPIKTPIKKKINSRPKKALDNLEIDNSVNSESNEITSDSAEAIYTMSPDGKYKIYKSELHSDRLEENKTNIPQLNIPGWKIAWPHDIRANSIHNMIARGYTFVHPNDHSVNGARLKVPAGRTQTGEAAFHYAMKIPESKFKELMIREEQERAAQEDALKRNPSKESNAIYGTEQMHFSRDVLGAKMA